MPHGRKRGPAGRLWQKGCVSPWGLCRLATATPSAGGEEEGPERSAAWEQRQAASPNWSWGRPQGRAGAGMRGAAFVERPAGRVGGRLTGHGVRAPATLSLPENWRRRPCCPWEMG